MIEVAQLKEAGERTLAEVNGLLKQLVHDPSTYVPVSQQELGEIVENNQTFVAVAREKGRIVGVGIIFVIHKFRGKYAYIEDMIVDEQYRGQGLGTKILQELVTIARSAQVKTIELSTRPSRVPANNLYKKMGFVFKETNVYRLSL